MKKNEYIGNKKGNALKITLGAMGLFGFVTLTNSLYTVNQTQQAVVTQFGKPVKVITNCVRNNDSLYEKLKNDYKDKGIEVEKGAGLKVKAPFIQQVNYFDRRLLEWDGYPEEIPTQDKKYIWVDTTARWYIEDPLKFMQTVRTEPTAHARLDDVIDSAVRDTITKRILIESVRNSNKKMEVSEKELETSIEVVEIKEGREKITKEITEKATKSCEDYGIRIVDVRMKGITYVDSVKEKVEDRMIAERKRVAELYRSEGMGEKQKIEGKKEKEYKTIISAAYKEAETIKGEADGKVIKIYADAFDSDPEFYQFLKTLDIYKEDMQKNTRFLLGVDSELFKYIKDFKSKEK